MKQSIVILLILAAAVGLGGCDLLQRDPILLVEAVVSVQVATDDLKVTVDGTASRGRNLVYIWDFDDGTILLDGGPIETHVYRVAGVYTIRLTVVETRGRMKRDHMASATVDLRDVNKPRAVIQVYSTIRDETPTHFLSWEQVLFVGTGSWDPNDSPLSYWWEIRPVDADGNRVASPLWATNPIVSNQPTFKIRLPGPRCVHQVFVQRVAVTLSVQNAQFGRDARTVYITVTGR